MDITPEIIDACRNNDRRAQFVLYRACYGMMMAICLRYEKNREDAEEVLNQAFLKVLTKLSKYDSNTPFEAWLRRITINTVIDEYRRKTRDKLLFLDSLETHLPLASMEYNEADRKFDAQDLEEMIKQLPPVSQKVFNLYVIDGYNHKEIAEMLGITEGTSKWHLSTSRKTLQKMLMKIMNRVASIVI